MTRDLNRTTQKIKQDILDTKSILREDIFALIENTSTKNEATALITEFFSDVNFGDIGYKTGDVNKILDDLDSYKEWDE